MASLRQRLERNKSGETSREADSLSRDFDNHLEAGFQLATFQGPLCAEPVDGLAYFVESLEIDRALIEQERGECTSGSILVSRQANIDF